MYWSSASVPLPPLLCASELTHSPFVTLLFGSALIASIATGSSSMHAGPFRPHAPISSRQELLIGRGLGRSGPYIGMKGTAGVLGPGAVNVRLLQRSPRRVMYICVAVGLLTPSGWLLELKGPPHTSRLARHGTILESRRLKRGM